MFRVTYTLRENKFVQSSMDFRYGGDWTVMFECMNSCFGTRFSVHAYMQCKQLEA